MFPNLEPSTAHNLFWISAALRANCSSCSFPYLEPSTAHNLFCISAAFTSNCSSCRLPYLAPSTFHLSQPLLGIGGAQYSKGSKFIPAGDEVQPNNTVRNPEEQLLSRLSNMSVT
ncbi:hypothetical protein E2C01_092218 [Portunus trituberculatus]|uniref:Uncharacterized protein n=1 Tax=Portunus trituberculatus TaxID=210409 RepID=A0A5B7JRF8_PORTR|nr:hypothetical protein [Portunus trituberculatus]